MLRFSKMLLQVYEVIIDSLCLSGAAAGDFSTPVCLFNQGIDCDYLSHQSAMLLYAVFLYVKIVFTPSIGCHGWAYCLKTLRELLDEHLLDALA